MSLAQENGLTSVNKAFRIFSPPSPLSSGRFRMLVSIYVYVAEAIVRGDVEMCVDTHGSQAQTQI